MEEISLLTPETQTSNLKLGLLFKTPRSCGFV